MKRDTREAKNNGTDERGRSFRLIRSISSVSCSLTAARSTAFARRVASMGRRLPAADIPAFLKYLFGVKPAISDARGFRGELVHKSPGDRLHQSFHTWIVKPVLSLTVNRLLPPFGSWLSQVYRVETTLKSEKHIHSPSVLQAQSTIERVLLKRFIVVGGPKSDVRQRQPVRAGVSTKPLVQRAAWIPGSPGESERTTANPGSMRQAPVYAGSISDRTIPLRAASVFTPSHSFTPDSILRPVSWAPDSWTGTTARRFRMPDIGAAALQSPAFIVSQPRAERWRPDWPQSHYRFREGNERRGAKDFGSIVGAGGRAIFKHSTLHFARPASTDRSESPVWPAHRESVSLRHEALAHKTLTRVERWFGLDRELVATVARVYEPVGKERLGGVGTRLTFLRREEQMRHPPQSYAYAQPVRPVMEEEQVIKREREIVEIVRKEVETSINSRSSMMELSRADYSRITDHVWFSLSRRLMREKERLGHR
jgi:hypothetical protein